MKILKVWYYPVKKMEKRADVTTAYAYDSSGWLRWLMSQDESTNNPYRNYQIFIHNSII
jgi:hypothetical protein